VIVNIAAYQTGSSWKAQPTQVGRGMIGRVVQEGVPMIVHDYPSWQGALDQFKQSPLTIRMAVPLRWQRAVIGVLLVLNHADGHHFDDDDQRLLEAFADLSAIALKNAELYTQVTSFKHTLEAQVAERTQELEQARREIIEKAEQVQWLLSKTVHIQEEERARIARDLHDSVTQLTIGALYELQAAKSDMDARAARRAREKIDTARDLLRQIEREIRQAISNLRPALLDASGLPTALQRYAANFQTLSSIQCEVVITGAPVNLPLPVEIVIFRIVQETLHNVLVHAEATHARVLLDFEQKHLCLTVQDNGKGFDPSAIVPGRSGRQIGLTSMRERAAVIGAQIEVTSEPNRGTQVTLQVNLQPS